MKSFSVCIDTWKNGNKDGCYIHNNVLHHSVRVLRSIYRYLANKKKRSEILFSLLYIMTFQKEKNPLRCTDVTHLVFHHLIPLRLHPPSSVSLYIKKKLVYEYIRLFHYNGSDVYKYNEENNSTVFMLVHHFSHKYTHW